MCFNVTSSCRKAKIAKKDILVFKKLKKYRLGQGVWVSPFQNYTYNFNNLTEYFSDKPLKIESPLSLKKIFHGIHCYRKVSQRRESNFNYIYECNIFLAIIPKGTKYFFNRYETVSEKIIFLGKLEKEFFKLNKEERLKEIKKVFKNKFDLTFEV